jgi:hypothetical protein
MSGDHTQARLQRIEKDVRNLSATVSVLAAVDSGAAKKRIQETFGTDPRMVIVYRGVQRGMTQQQIADAAKARGLPAATQPRISEALDVLEEQRFIERAPRGQRNVLPGWEAFGLERVLKRTLKTHNVDDLS